MDSYIKEIDDLLDDLSVKMKEDKEWLWSFVYEDINEADESAIEMYIRDVIKKGLLGWKHKIFEASKQSQEDHDCYTSNPFEAEEGVVECIKCSSTKVYSVSVQTRASDESMTTMAQCTLCKTKWSYNG
jgi:DNA-directed RNA polymerase subunit M/transcription elongation factor TFIIS